MTYVVCATWTAKDGEEDAVAAAVHKLAHEAPDEPGMVLYQAHRDPQNPRSSSSTSSTSTRPPTATT